MIRRRRDPLRPDEHRELLAMIGATTAGIIVLILVTIGYLITPR